MNEIILSVKTVDEFFDEAIASARRIDEGDMTPQTPRLSFHSLEDLYQTLDPFRWQLLDTLRRIGPSTRSELSTALERDPALLAKDLEKLLPIGLVEEDEAGLLSVPWAKITTEVVFDRNAA